jgi:hypothetical protein
VRTVSADPGDRRGGGRRGQDRTPPAAQTAVPQVDGAEVTVDDWAESLETVLSSDDRPTVEAATASAIP